MNYMKHLAAIGCLIILHAVTASAGMSCRQVVAPSEFSAIESQLAVAKNLKEMSSIDIGNFSSVQENLLRQKKFLQLTLDFASQKGVEAGLLNQILEVIDKAIVTKAITYADYWMLHFAMQEVADFDFSLRSESISILDEKSIHYVLKKLADAKFDLTQLEDDSKSENRIKRSFGLLHHYTDFNNPRFSEAKKANVVGEERIPFPFFQRGFDIVEINNLARTSRIRPVEIMSGVNATDKDGNPTLAVPIIDGRPMGVGKDASDHDFNHLGFEVSAKATRELGRVMFENSDELSAEGQMVLNVIYFKAWHEWGINLSAFEPGQQWNILLNANSLRADMTNPHILGGDPEVVKSVPAIDSTLQFLKQKNLPNFWEGN